MWLHIQPLVTVAYVMVWRVLCIIKRKYFNVFLSINNFNKTNVNLSLDSQR
jgi:hypothetical protein